MGKSLKDMAASQKLMFGKLAWAFPVVCASMAVIAYVMAGLRPTDLFGQLFFGICAFNAVVGFFIFRAIGKSAEKETEL